MSTHQNRHEARKAAALAKRAAVQATKPPPKIVAQAHGSDQAPVIYFDGAVSFGLAGSHAMLVELAISTSIPVTIDGKDATHPRTVITCHLRGTTEAFAQLAETIERCLTTSPAISAPPAEASAPMKEAAE